MALAIATFGAGQVYVAWDTARGTTAQTQQLITAAGINATAAKQNAQASSNFAKSSEAIKIGIDDAVTKLALQAQATESARLSAVEESSKLLKATIENFGVEQRPWVVLSSNPTGSIEWKAAREWGFHFKLNIQLRNLGKTPATSVRVSQVIGQVVEGMDRPEPKLRDQVCNSVSEGQPIAGSIIYPSTPPNVIEREVWVPGSQIKREAAQHSAVTVIIAVCVSYRPTYQVEKPYKFGVVYNIGQKSDRPGETDPLPYIVVGQDNTPILLPDPWATPDIN